MRGNIASKITIVLLSFMVVGLTLFNVCYAIFFDRETGSGIVQFSEQRLDIEVLGENKTIQLTPSELNIDVATTKNLKINNPNTSTNCVFRIWLEFKIDNVEDDNYLELIIEDGFTKSDDNKFYYNRVFNTGSEISNLPIQFKVKLQDVDISKYEGKAYSMKLHVEAVQANKSAIQEIFTNYPTEWLTGLGI